MKTGHVLIYKQTTGYHFIENVSILFQIYGLVRDYSISTASAVERLQSCIKLRNIQCKLQFILIRHDKIWVFKNVFIKWYISMLFFIDVFFELWIYIVVCPFRVINHFKFEFETHPHCNKIIPIKSCSRHASWTILACTEICGNPNNTVTTLVIFIKSYHYYYHVHHFGIHHHSDKKKTCCYSILLVCCFSPKNITINTTINSPKSWTNLPNNLPSFPNHFPVLFLEILLIHSPHPSSSSWSYILILIPPPLPPNPPSSLPLPPLPSASSPLSPHPNPPSF